MRKDVKIGGLDAVQQAVIDADQHLQRGAAILVDEGQQLVR